MRFLVGGWLAPDQRREVLETRDPVKPPPAPLLQMRGTLALHVTLPTVRRLLCLLCALVCLLCALVCLCLCLCDAVPALLARLH